MSGHDMAKLACRVLGVYLIVQGVNMLTSLFYTMVQAPVPTEGLPPVVVYGLLYLLTGAFLWVLAGRLGAAMIGKEKQAEEGERLDTEGVQRIVFSALGLYFMANSLSRIVSAITLDYAQTGYDSSLGWALHYAGPVSQLLIGLAVFLGSRGLANFLSAMRNAGLKKEEGNAL